DTHMTPTRRFSSEELEKYSCAISLSDMEIFIFPELLYSLVLSNIMSPIIWEWKKDPWFAKLDTMKPYRKVLRLKQFIMDTYEFNLDLDTWGLTDKEAELTRFRGIIDEDTLSRSNALFGYEGDKYYFDIDIRRHFGLDKYNSNTIPYWKTETAEAMSAFKHKEGYSRGAGECVSLSTLYAAALYVICDIPLEDIFLLATPLHSQNYICVNEGVITNNRRIVTKNMWFNGTVLTDKAQRALRNEQVTIVANNTGYVHYAYPEHTISPDSFDKFSGHLAGFLSANRITYELLTNFLRQHNQYQKCFQLCFNLHGKPHWFPVETGFRYEHGSPYKVSDNTRNKLLSDIDDDEFYTEPLEGRICLGKLEKFLKSKQVKHDNPKLMKELAELMTCGKHDIEMIMKDLTAFAHLEPRLPELAEKTFKAGKTIELEPGMSRNEVIDYLDGIRDESLTADLAFYAYRDLAQSDWQPFIKAALERNPVCCEATDEISDETLHEVLTDMPDDSIYDNTRLAQPDEVWNFQRGDGLEKAITFATIWKKRNPGMPAELRCDGENAELTLNNKTYAFSSTKGLTCEIEL
ncbi:hypothetical protein ACFLQY_05185, partial [Verrucomicrobiota bacterium]